MNPVAQTSAKATFQGGASAPMDIDALAAALWKGKGKGKKGKGKGGKGKGKDFSKSQGKGNSQHWNFMKGKGKAKGKGEPLCHPTSVCWSCGKTGHFASNCPTYRVQLLMVMINFGMMTKAIGLTLVSLRTGRIGPNGQSMPLANFTTAVGIRLGMIHFGLGSLGIPGIGVGLRTLLQNLGLQRPLLRRRPKL